MISFRYVSHALLQQRFRSKTSPFPFIKIRQFLERENIQVPAKGPKRHGF